MSGPARPTFPPARRGPGAGGGLDSGRRRGEGGDEAVRLTNDDAAGAKVSCVAAGYLRDGFVGSFVRSARRARRPPLINRGYWSRVQALRQLLLAFLGDHPDGQVVVLGCGYDTTFFKLAAEGEARGRWWEVDFPQVAASKARVVTGDAKFTAHLGDEAGREVDLARGSVAAGRYTLCAGDLREMAEVGARLRAAGLDPDAPTFVLSECVLVYLPPEASEAVVAYFGGAFARCTFVVYEMVEPGDGFGQQMVRNLQDRGCELLGIHANPTCAAQEARLRRAGFAEARALDMLAVYGGFLDAGERRRIERLELFDELEEWRLIQRHYCIAVGTKGPPGLDGLGFRAAPAAGGPGRAPGSPPL